MVVPHLFDPFFFITESCFTVIAVIFCFAIYYRTRESYELTKYEGIRYFRDAFLFFGLSYLVRFVLGFVSLSRMALAPSPPRNIFPPFVILFLGYFSTMGIFYLFFSSHLWKRFNSRKLLVFGHSLAFLLSAISFITRSHIILLYLQSVLLTVVALLSFPLQQRGKKLSQMRILYLLVSCLWLINLWVIDLRRPLPFGIEIFFQLLSLAVFIMLYYKVSKWVR